MQLRNNNFYLQVLTVCFFAAAATIVGIRNGHAAMAEPVKTPEPFIYQVKDGDFLGAIAMANNTTVEEIMRANNLENPDRIAAGMELLIPVSATAQKACADAPAEAPAVQAEAPKKKKPEPPKRVTIKVPKGFPLSRIARSYDITVAAILKANPALRNPDDLKAGQKLIIPGAEREIELVPPPPCFAPPVEFYRVRTNETKKISLTFCNGRVNPAGVEELSRFSYPVELEEMPFPLHPRLALLLQRVSDHYRGKRLEPISGQRLQRVENHESYHNKGQAMDFRVQGISNKALVSYVRTFEDVGVGYYPNSVFVHLDARERSAYWIDYSRPGEQAIYGKADMTVAQVEAVRASRLAAAKQDAALPAIASISSETAQADPALGAEAPTSDDDALRRVIDAAIDRNIEVGAESVVNALETAQLNAVPQS